MVSRYVISVINIALAAVIGHSAMVVWLLIRAAPVEYNNPSPQIVANQAQISNTTINISTLLNAHLFGQANSPTITGAYKKNTAPVTKLPDKLHGIYYSSNSPSSFAIIAAANGKSAHYRLGQSLPSGALIHEIFPKKVILLRNGRYETLHLLGSKKFATNKPTVKQNFNTKSNFFRPEKLLGNYQRQLQTNPNRLMKLIRIYPVKQGGRFVGFRLKPGRNPTLLSHFNLQTGDILTSVNGIKLNSPLKGFSVIQQLATARQVDLQVLRNGQIVSLSFAVEK